MWINSDMLPSLRPARRFSLSLVWQRSNESRGNGVEGRSYRNQKGTWESTRTREHPLSCDFSFCSVFCVLICSLANRQRTSICISCTVLVFCFYRPETGEIIRLFVWPAGNWPRVKYSAWFFISCLFPFVSGSRGVGNRQVNFWFCLIVGWIYWTFLLARSCLIHYFRPFTLMDSVIQFFQQCRNTKSNFSVHTSL